MERNVIVQGILSDPTHIELDEPVTNLHGTVEVILRPIRGAITPATTSGDEAWEEAFDAWVDGHDRLVRLPHPDALVREALYDERL